MTGTERWLAITAGAGVLGGVAWTAKVVTLWATGTEGGLDQLFFGVGFAALLLAATGPGVWLLRGRPVAWRVLGGVLGPPLGVLIFLVGVQGAVEPVNPALPFGLAGEVGIVLAALAGVVLGGGRLVRVVGDPVSAPSAT
ncbi:hypothetical protein GCM10009772_40770 [Pseudonocardia alni subsp. carboxydivorans]|uniref:Secreted protein with PEP-CTERM sorting signal n=1 Tax=Pseudonocardia alni subsp. carboxydivorans TaxID=415010 RepID=A0ABU9A966_PSEA5